ncbi:membrane glycoprotein US11 [Human betaherpesvirus 5]|uniref:Membrane glycoprotein US11 n=1 Tax=Human cytomegalovirus TaxID=10359 RepID=A0A0G2TLK3_HCMV|nr:membrane glycoprotein US11 [Human betaherpesvirus 5]
MNLVMLILALWAPVAGSMPELSLTLFDEPPPLVETEPLPPLPDVSEYRVEYSEARCVLRSGGRLEALLILRGNLSVPTPTPRVYYQTLEGYADRVPTPVEDISESLVAKRYWLRDYRVPQRTKLVLFYFSPCHQCQTYYVECEPRCLVPWVPLWSSLEDIERLLFEDRRLMAYYALTIKSAQYTLMMVAVIQVFWGLYVKGWLHRHFPWMFSDQW